MPIETFLKMLKELSALAESAPDKNRQSVADVMLYGPAKYKFFEAALGLTSNALLGRGIENVFPNLLGLAPNGNEEGFARTLFNMTLRMMESGFRDMDAPITKLGSVPKLTAEEYMRRIAETRDLFEDKSVFDKTFANIVYTAVSMDYHGFREKGSFETFLTHLTEVVGELTDDCVPDEASYAVSTEIGGAADEHPYAAQIEELKKGCEGDPEALSALDEANRILIVGASTHVHFTGGFAEDVGTADDTAKVEDGMRYCKEDPDLRGYSFEATRRFINLPANAPQEDYAKVTDAILKKRIPLAEGDKEKIKAMIRTIRESGIFLPGTFEAEGDFKTYSMRALVDAQKKVRDAVEKKDIPAIVAAGKEYAAIEKAYDGLIAEATAIHPGGHIVSNISSSREGGIPAKYRNDPIGVSRLTGLWMFLGLCDLLEVSPERVVDDPLAGICELTEAAMTKKNRLQTYLKTGDLAEVLHGLLTGDEKTASLAKQDEIAAGAFGRALEGLTVLFPETEGVELNRVMMIFRSVFPLDQTAQIAAAPYTFRTEKVEKIRHLLFVEPEDRDLFALDEKNLHIDPVSRKPREPFDPARYLAEGKTSGARVIDRVLKTLEDMSAAHPDSPALKSVKKAAVSTARLVRDLPVGRAVRNAAAAIEKGHPERIPASDRKIVAVESVFFETVKGGVRAANVGAAIRAIADLRKEYDKNSFFAKIFSFAAGRQSAAIRGMKNALVAAGVDRAALNRAVSESRAPDGSRFAITVSAIETVLLEREPKLEPAPEPGIRMNVKEAAEPDLLPEEENLEKSAPVYEKQPLPQDRSAEKATEEIREAHP